MTTYPLRRAAAMLTGIALIAAETQLSLTHIRNTAEAWHDQPLVIAVLVAGVAQAVAMSVLAAARRQRRWGLVATTTVGLLAAVAFTFSTTYERTAGAREFRAQIADQANSPLRQSASRVASLEARTAAECSKRGAECRRLEAELTEARAVLAAQPAERSARVLGRLDIVPELALPLMLMLLGFAFIEFAGETPAPRISRRDSAQTSFSTIEPPPANIFVPDMEDRPTPVTEREAQVESFVKAHIAKHGRAPRHRDVVKATGLPKATASRYMKRVTA